MRSHARVSGVVVAVFAFLALAAAPAPAAYMEVGSFAEGGSGPGGSGSGNGEILSAEQSAVYAATGDLYVADTGNNRVQVFKPNATGAQYDSQVAISEPTGIAIDQGDGSVYVANATGIAKLDSSLAPVGAGWTDPGVTGRLAVDPASGDLLVADRAANLIRRYEADGTAAGSFAAEGPADLAVANNGDVLVIISTGDFVLDCSATSAVRRFSSAGTDLGAIGASLSAPGAIAVVPGDGTIAIASRVNRYNCGSELPLLTFFDPSGTELESDALAPDTQYATVPGLAAAGGETSRVYVTTRSPLLDDWGVTRITAFEIPPPAPPAIVGQAALSGREAVTLRATINPGGEATDYYFEYGTTSSYGETSEVEAVGGGFDNIAVSTRITGLTPGQTYYFRAVATNALGQTEGADRTFTTFGGGEACPNDEYRYGLAAELNDCRAYELVTPVGSEASLRPGGAVASADGGTVCFNTEDVMAGSDPNGIKLPDDGFCAWREQGGWRTEWVTGPAPKEPQPAMGSNVYFLSADGRRVIFGSDAMPFGEEVTQDPGTTHGSPISAYMWDGGETRWVAPAPRQFGDPTTFIEEGGYRPWAQGNDFGYTAERRPLAASADGTRGLFESDLPLVPRDQNEDVDVYEWSPAGIRLISEVFGLHSHERKAAGGRVPLSASYQTSAQPGAISADGSRVFFLHEGRVLDFDAPAPEGEVIQSVYMREGDEVTHLSERFGGEDAEATFLGASSDGEIVYMESTQPLSEEPKQFGSALYRHHVSSGETELVASPLAGVDGLGISADGSTVVYRELLSGALVVNRNGNAETLGTLDATDVSAEYRVASPRYDQRMLRLTPDGRVVVFGAAGEFAGSPKGPLQIYRWEDGEGVERISAGDGASPERNASIAAYTSMVPGNPREEFLYQHYLRGMKGRVISEDGSRVFFETPEALVDRDVNDLTDVYEWHDGKIDLISPGTGGKSLYHDSSADGSTVYFTTYDRLIPELDRNTARDLYAARTEGGFPLPAAPPDCEGEACRPSGPPAPPARQPAASGGDGEGNLPAGPKLGALGRKQLAELAGKGRTTIRVSVATPGRVTALLRGKLGKGAAKIVARASKAAPRAGTVSLTLKLSKAARQRLAEDGRLRLTLEVSQPSSDQTARKEVMLRG